MSSDWLVDARHAARLVRRQPRFAAAAILLLATRIGAAAAVFTLVNAVVLVDMPFRDPDRLAWMYNARTERDRAPLSIPDLQDYSRDARTLEGLAPFTIGISLYPLQDEIVRDYTGLLRCSAPLGFSC